MKIKITPEYKDPSEKKIFDDLVHKIMLQGWIMQLIHFPDDSVMLRSLTPEEHETVKKLLSSKCL